MECSHCTTLATSISSPCPDSITVGKFSGVSESDVVNVIIDKGDIRLGADITAGVDGEVVIDIPGNFHTGTINEFMDRFQIEVWKDGVLMMGTDGTNTADCITVFVDTGRLDKDVTLIYN